MSSFKRIMSFILAFVMVFGMLPPAAASASETEGVETAVTVETTAAAQETVAVETTLPETTAAAEETAAAPVETTAPTESEAPTEPETTQETSETVATEATEEALPVETAGEEISEEAAAEAAVITVHYYNADNWATVNGYVWESSASNNAWPGSALSENSEHSGWYDLTVTDDDGAFWCIFNNGTVQTEAIPVDYSDGTLEFWYVADALTKTMPGSWNASDVEVTRAAWIQALVSTFSMTVEADNYPDNYYSDLTGQEEFYRDIMVAVEFGIIDLDAGQPFRPYAPATREFAAQTLNHALGFRLDADAEYTFAEAATVTYPDDIQVAINRGWFELSNGAFLPDAAVTTAEKTAMLADAAAVLEGDQFSKEYDNSVSAAEGVLVLPGTTVYTLSGTDRIHIENCPEEIKAGDIFVVYNGPMPVVLKALSVTEEDTITTVLYTLDGTEGALLDYDFEGTVTAELENFEGTDATTMNINNRTVYLGKTISGIEYDNNKKVLTASKSISLGDGIDASINVKISDLKFDTKAKKGEDYRIVMKGDATLSTGVSVDVLEMLGAAKTVELGKVRIFGIGVVSVAVEFSLSGEMTLTWKGDIQAGFSYKKGDGFRLITSFKKKEFSFMTEVNIKTGVVVTAGVDVIFASANIWARIGAQMNIKAIAYDSGTPLRCLDMEGYMYASVGASAEIFLIGEFSKSADIFTRTNSPIRARYHYEDGSWVGGCSRGNGSGYYTSPGSGNFTPGASNGSGSYTGADGTPVVIFTYTLDADNNATITGYLGGASALYIPSTIDGYTVTGIASKAFRENKRLYSVRIADTVNNIGAYAFEKCGNLAIVTLPKSLTVLGCGAFQNCVSLTTVNIPGDFRTGEHCGNGMYPGPFNGCSSLQDITFAEGITYLPDALFSGSGIRSIDLPDTITSLRWKVFQDCTKLERISLPANLTHIASSAFIGCTALTQVVLPDTMVELGCGAFQNCTALTSVNIPKDMNTGAYCGNKNYPGPFSGCSSLNNITFGEEITRIPNGLFFGCNGVTSLVIPNSVTQLGWKAFCSSVNLQSITLSNCLTSIEGNCFEGSTALKEIELPKSMTVLGCGAFMGCTGLQKVNIPKGMRTGEHCGNKGYPGPFNGCSSLTEVTFDEGIESLPDGLFWYATGLKKIEIPNTVTKIGWKAFLECANLETVTIPESVTSIGAAAFQLTGLTEVLIPNSVTATGDHILADCPNLKKVTWTTGVAKIPEYAFSGCVSLTEAILPETTTELGKGTFRDCDAMTAYDIPDGVVTMRNEIFYDCDLLASIEIPQKVTSIGASAFQDCDALETVTMGDSVTSLGNNIFYHCDVLKDVKLSRNLTTIPASAFQNCALLEEITVPYYVTSIGNNAFNASPKLAKVVMPRGLTSIGTTAFSYADITVIYGVPGTYAETWATENGYQFVAHEVPATAATLTAPQQTMNNGASQTLVLTVTPADFTDAITWKSSDTAVVTVSDKGVVKAVGVGTATIKVTVGSVGANCKITVIQPVTSITLNKYSLNLESLATYQLTATPKPSNAANKDVTWNSSDEAIATVDATGLVTAIAKGTATITATAADGSGITRSCTVTVENTGYVVTDPTQMESSHNYPDSCTDFWIYTLEDAKFLKVTFDAKTMMEDGFDYLNIYDGIGALVGTYTGAALAGATIEVPGDTVKIKLNTDNSGNEWGFKVTAVEAGVVVLEDLTTTVGTEEELLEILGRSSEYGNVQITITHSITLTEDVTIPENVTLIVGTEEEPVTLTIPGGVTVTNEGTMTITSGSHLHVGIGGELINRNNITISEGAKLTNEGEINILSGAVLENNGELLMSQDAILEGTVTGEQPIFGCVNGHTEAIDPAVAPNCTETGLTEGSHCAECGMVLTAQEVVPALGHAEVTDKAVEPTCTETGLTEGKHCSRCGETLIAQTVVPATGHTAVVDKAIAPTCTEPGLTEGSHCAVCSEILVTQEEIPATGHEFVDGFCQICGESDKADYDLFSGKSMTLKIMNPATGKVYSAKQVSWSMDEINEPFATLAANGKLTAKKVLEKIRIFVEGTILETGETVTYSVDLYPAVTQVEAMLDGEALANNAVVLMDFTENSKTIRINTYPADTLEIVEWSVSDKKGQYADYEISEDKLTITNPTGKAGTVTVKATVNAGAKKNVTIKVQFGSFAKTVEIAEPEKTTIRGGETLVLSAAITEPDFVSKPGIVWSVSDKTAATVSGGKVKAKNVAHPTTVTVVAASKDGQAFDTIDIEILPKNEGQLVLMAEDTFITNTTIALNTGDSYQLEAYTILAGEPVGEEVTWSSAKTAVAEVNEKGLVTAMGSGTAKITALTDDGRKATVSIKVTTLVEDMILTTKDGENLIDEDGETLVCIPSGKGVNLVANVLTQGAAKAVTWQILEGAGYAKLSSSGKLTANKDITKPVYVTVIATAKDGSGYAETIRVKIVPLATGVQIFERGVRVRSNTTYISDLQTNPVIQLTTRVYPANAMQNVVLTSSNKKVAYFDEFGDLICVGTGSTNITATAQDGSKQKSTFKLTVVNQIADITLKDGVLLDANGDLFVAGGKSLKLATMIDIYPENATNKKLTWSVPRNNAGISINASGVLKTGKVTAPVTVNVMALAQDGSGEMLSFNVTVYPATTKVSLYKDGSNVTGKVLFLKENDSIRLTTASSPDNAAGVYTWSSSDEDYVFVDEDGTVSALQPGKVITITATAADGSGKKAVVKIKVT